MYRLAFDNRVGFACFVTIVVAHWSVVACELAGVLPAQPINPSTLDGVYLVAERQIGAMINLSVGLALAYVVAHWAVARIRHKDVAIRLLRESLYANERGKVGRHTGRTLRDTYALGALLGSGGMGEVYKATHLRTQREVAVKLLHAHFVDDAHVLSRFRREAEITGRLGSAHIVQVLDVDEDEGQPFLVLELLQGESLAARLKANGRVSLEQTIDIVDQIASALDLAHAAGVVHRDLKPENVFLCDATAKLLDFGVSKIRGSAITQDVAVLGTPDYMSPEQAAGGALEVEASSDVFSLGGMVYTMLTAQRPFVADTVPGLLRAICDREPTPIGDHVRDLPPEVIAVVGKAMAKSPTDRFATAGDFARELRGAAGRRRHRRDSMTTGKTFVA
jgi:serine/threonine-protein kinase